MFLVKYDSGGAVLGSVTVGGLASSQVELGGLTIDGDDNLIIAGSFDSPTLQIGSTSLNSAGNYDILIAKYDSSMNPLWAKSVGGNLDEFVTGISDQGNGNIIISGHFNSGTLVFGGIILFNTDPPDVFIAALSSSVGVESLDHESKLIVWPNPSNGLINIEGQHRIKEVSIVDCLGRVIEIKHPNSATATISIGKRGIYILKVITDQSVICKTVIVNRD